MTARFSLLPLFFALVLTVTHSPGTTLPDDAKPFTRAELYQYLAEKTQVRINGGTFHSDAGTLFALKNGKRYQGSWSTNNDGMLCWHVYAWGPGPCERYYHTGDSVTVLVNGVASSAPHLQKGDTLNLLKSKSGLFSQAQTIAFLSGKTVILGPGQGLYYGPDFTLTKLWNNVMGQGTWTVTTEGQSVGIYRAGDPPPANPITTRKIII